VTPTIGRKVWFYGIPKGDAVQHNPNIPMDATIVYPWPGEGDYCNLLVLDHVGKQFPVQGVEHKDHATAAAGYVHWDWMPFQKGQAEKADTDGGLADRVARIEQTVGNGFRGGLG
jgi:hypothetical protein